MYLLGYDIGSSSIKASLLDEETGECIASSYAPEKEMRILSQKNGWAEQDPIAWWNYLIEVTHKILAKSCVNKKLIRAIGISYQMHGLVLIDKKGEVLRSSIIWCDSRATPYGESAFLKIGENECLEHVLNSPGNFTASKLAWVKENEPKIFEKTRWIMLPGDYISFKMTGEATTTVSGLSEGIFWDFKNNRLFNPILNFFGFSEEIFPRIVPTLSIQGELTSLAANELGLEKGTLVAYRAGDQPNNAFSLNVLNPGEIAATAGTSGVVYGIIDKIQYDPLSRINTFSHVNHSSSNTRLGILLCINGTGILNSWVHNLLGNDVSYNKMNELAESIPIGSNGLSILPFGNGSERVFQNRNIGANIFGVNFNIHSKEDIFRAVQEGIVFAFKYGINIMKEIGLEPSIIKAGNANMFISPVFREALATSTNSIIELYNTNGSEGAARGAGIGSKIYSSFNDGFRNLKKISTTEPTLSKSQAYTDAYHTWEEMLLKIIES